MSLKRPFVPLCAVALISVLLCRFSYFLLLALPVFIVAFGIYSVRKGGKKRVYTGLCVVMLFLSFYPPIYEVFHAAKKVPYADDAEYRGVVTEISYGKYTATAYVRITDGPYRSETCRIRIPHDWAQPALFDTIRFYGNVLPSQKAESGTALYRLYAKDARLCAARLYGWNPVEAEAKDRSFRKSVYFLLRERLSELFDGDTCAMALALLTGDRTGLSDARTEAFRRAGLYPFLCISGVHVMLTTGLLRKLLRKIHTPKAVQIPILLAFLAAFAVIGGASGSILRASIMAAVMWIAPICMREYDSVSALCFAFLILWLKNPYMIYDLGIELSFAATLGVIMAGELQKDLPYPRLGRRIFPSVAASVYAVGFTSFLCIENIGGLALLGPFSNLIAGFFFVPAMAILVVVSLISFLPFFPAIKGILRIGAWGCRLFLNGFELTAKAFAAIPGSYAEISFPSAVSGIISVLCVSALFYSLAFSKRKNADIWASVSAVLPYSLTLISALVCEIAGIR